MSQRKPLLDLCCTRWAQRHDAYMHFYQSYVFIVDALKAINGSASVNFDPCFFQGWDIKTKSKARSMLDSITSFDFTATVLVV